MRSTRARAIASIAAAAAALAMFFFAGRALVVDVPLQHPDGIVSLASHEWERLPVAARLARQYPAATVILTQPPIVTAFNCHDCGNRVAWLGQLGVARERIRVVPVVESSTYGEAIAIRGALASGRDHRLLVVTSPYHTRRALSVFRHVMDTRGIQVGVEPAWPESPARPARWWSAPYDRWYVAYEWAGLIDYLLRGHLSWE